MEAPFTEGRLSPQQWRLWRLQKESGPLFAQVAVRLDGELRTELLERAWDGLVARHESLRAVYPIVSPAVSLEAAAGEAFPVQRVLAAVKTDWETADLRGLDPAEQSADLARRLAEHRGRTVDPATAPVLFLSLISLEPLRHVLLVTLPSLGADARTLRNLVRQLAADYDRLAGGASDQGEGPEEIQYLQFAEWQLQLLEEDEAQTGREIWRSVAANAVPLPFEGERTSPKWSTEVASRSLALPLGLMSTAERLASRRGVPLSTVLLTAWQALLARLTESRDAVVAVRFEGRKYGELQSPGGLFNRWLPIRLTVEAKTRFEDALARVQGSLDEAESWQEYFPAPEAEIARAGFVFTEWPENAVGGGLTFTIETLRVDDEPVRLTLAGQLRHGHLELSLLHDPELFSADAAAYLAERYGALLIDALDHPSRAVGDLDLLGAAEERRLTGEWGRGESGLRWDAPFHLAFSLQAARTPEAYAVTSGERTLSYGELDARANQLAHALRRRGVGAGSLVPVWGPRSPELLIALLGVLKAGAAYVPLDPALPRERLGRILSAVSPLVIVTWGSLPEDDDSDSGRSVLRLDADAGLAAESRLDPGVIVPRDSLAYVLYTSGSTGVPKGVMITHRGLANYLGWAAGFYDVAAGGGAVVHSPIGFDLTVTSLLSPLICGGRALLLPEETGIEGVAAALASAEVALFKMTPSHLDAVTELLRAVEVRESPRLLVVGGEALAARTLEAWWVHDPRSVVVNEYGPTETVVGCCVARLSQGATEGGPVPIGRPIANTSAYVLDPLLRPVAAGGRGELCVAGEGLARGYLGMPELTASRFVPDPFSERPGARLYRTGDLARWRLDGQLEFVGRLDLQVKIRGHRVEPAEIELALARHAAIADAIVLAQPGPGEGNRLVAYCTTGADPLPAAGELRAFLQRELPEYMIPSVFVPVAAFPLTANGKVDREALLSQGTARTAPEVAYVAPETELERVLAAIWKEVLRVERVGLYDNFFDLGGHSLLMVQVFSRIKAQIDTELIMVELFEFPTVSSMAKRLAQEREQLAPSELTPGRAEARLETALRLDDDAAAARINSRRSFEDV